MATYYVKTHDLSNKTLYKGTSLSKAKKICDACEEICTVTRFTGYNIPLPVEHWNEAFETYVHGRGKECFVGMTHW